MSTTAPDGTTSVQPFSLGPTLPPSSQNSRAPITQAGLIGLLIAIIIVAAVAIMAFRYFRVSREYRSIRAMFSCSPNYRHNSRPSTRRRPSNSGSAWSQEAVLPNMSSQHPTLNITPALLYSSGLGPIPTTYNAGTPSPSHGRHQRTLAADVDAGGRRLGPRNSEDGLNDDKEELPAYQRQNPGLPSYVELGTGLPPPATHPSA